MCSPQPAPLGLHIYAHLSNKYEWHAQPFFDQPGPSKVSLAQPPCPFSRVSIRVACDRMYVRAEVFYPDFLLGLPVSTGSSCSTTSTSSSSYDGSIGVSPCGKFLRTKFALQFVYERWRKDAERIYQNAKQAGVRLAALVLIRRNLDHHMKDVDLTQKMINDIVHRSPALKRLRDSINIELPNPHLISYCNPHDFSSYRLPEYRGGKPMDHRKQQAERSSQQRQSQQVQQCSS